MPRPLTRADRQLAGTLQRYLGDVAGVRRSAADIAAQLPTLDQRTPRTKEIVREKATAWVAAGVAVEAPGPRGGQGWALSPVGADLIRRTRDWRSPAALRAEQAAAAREARKVDYQALIARQEGRELVTVRALTITEAAELARRQCRWTGERVLGVWESGEAVPASPPASR